MIITKPIITEKSLALAANHTYTFAVNDEATRAEVAKAVEQVYGVKVAKVRVMSVTGQTVRRRTGLGKTQDFKKALVTLKPGQTLKDFEFEAETADKNSDKADKKDKK